MLFHCHVITHHSIILDCGLLLTLLSNSNGRLVPSSFIPTSRRIAPNNDVFHPIIHVSIWLAVRNTETIQTFALHSAHSRQCSWSDTILPDTVFIYASSICSLYLISPYKICCEACWRFLFYQIVRKLQVKDKM